MFKTIRTNIHSVRRHFAEAAKYRRLIAREHLVLNRDKILPSIVLDTLIHWPRPLASQIHMRMLLMAPYALQRRASQVLQGDADYYTAQYAELPQSFRQTVDVFTNHAVGLYKESLAGRLKHANRISAALDEMDSRLVDMQSGIEAGRYQLICRPIGEWLEDFEWALADPKLEKAGKTSCNLGEGRQAYRFWRRLNAQPDWKRYVTRFEPFDQPPPRDPRRKETIRTREPAPVWAPIPSAM